MTPPPRIVRRIVVAPIVAALDLFVIALSPLVLLLACAGGPRAIRAVLVVAAFCAHHLRAMLTLAALWARRAGEDEHYAVMRRFVAGAAGAIVRLARVEIRTDESEDAYRALEDTRRPVVLLARHAGEGDTLLVLRELLCRHARRPRIVMHEALRWDPVIDVLGTRLPNRFVDPRGGDTEVEIAALAREMDERAALVIFPEGANFSEERRRRGIARLERDGHEDEAAAARAMRHVSAPRPGGALAAIEACPDADVVVLGHAGFPTGLREAWDLLPARQVIEVKLWLEPAGSVPRDRDAQIDWLFERWRRLDDWVAERV